MRRRRRRVLGWGGVRWWRRGEERRF
uniref:Uncharacterized protein n=1 Tax=Arundo donax TaxID=35708 RepID=A0A0A9FNR5_ARUDO